MKEAIGTAMNILRVNATGKKWETSIEMIFVVSEPVFQIDASGCMVKIRNTDTLRFVTTVNAAKKISADILKWIAQAEKDEQEISSNAPREGSTVARTLHADVGNYGGKA